MKLKFWVMPVLTVILMASCNNETIDQSQSSNFPSDGLVRIATGINNSSTPFQSKKKGLSDENLPLYEGDSLSLTIDYGAAWDKTQQHIKWATTDHQTWQPEQEMWWKDASVKCNIYAFAPYKRKTFNGYPQIQFSIKDDQSKGTVSSDLVSFVKNDVSPGEILNNKQLPITFKHLFSKLTVNMTIKNNDEKLYVKRMQICKGIIMPNVYFNIRTGKITGVFSSNIKTPLIMDSIPDSNYDASYCAVFPPQAISAESTFGRRFIEITLSNDQTYYYELKYNHTLKFEGGKAYSLNLSIGKDKVSMDSSVTLCDWDDGGNLPDDGGSTTTYNPGDLYGEGIIFWVGDPTKDDPALKRDHPECTHGLAVALTNSKDVTWEDSISYTSNWMLEHLADLYQPISSHYNGIKLNKLLGYNNTKAIEAYNAAPENSATIVKAIEGLQAYRDSVMIDSNTSGWYLPSAKELWKVSAGTKSYGDIYHGRGTKMRDLVNKRVGELRQKGIYADSLYIDQFYCSSTEEDDDSTKIWSIKFKDGDLNSPDKKDRFHVRYVFAF